MEATKGLRFDPKAASAGDLLQFAKIPASLFLEFRFPALVVQLLLVSFLCPTLERLFGRMLLLAAFPFLALPADVYWAAHPPHAAAFGFGSSAATGFLLGAYAAATLGLGARLKIAGTGSGGLCKTAWMPVWMLAGMWLGFELLSEHLSGDPTLRFAESSPDSISFLAGVLAGAVRRFVPKDSAPCADDFDQDADV